MLPSFASPLANGFGGAFLRVPSAFALTNREVKLHIFASVVETRRFIATTL